MVDEEVSNAETLFDLGTVVSLRADPGRTGPIIAELDAVGGRRRFRVYHSASLIRDYFEDQLSLTAELSTPSCLGRTSSGGRVRSAVGTSHSSLVPRATSRITAQAPVRDTASSTS